MRGVGGGVVEEPTRHFDGSAKGSFGYVAVQGVVRVVVCRDGELVLSRRQGASSLALAADDDALLRLAWKAELEAWATRSGVPA